MSAAFQHVLLTGHPGCGKTTVVQRLVDRLADLRLAGFYTRELREEGHRVGFEAIGLHGGKATLAHVASRSPTRVGKYGVELDQFETLVRQEFERQSDDVDLYIVDEVGKMECFSEMFVETIRRILDGEVAVVATVACKGGGLIQEAKTRSDVEVVTVTRENRDRLPAELAERLRPG